MPLSKKRDRLRKRRERAKRALLGEVGYWKKREGEVRRELEAKEARVEWQRGAIRMLQEEIGTLSARIASVLHNSQGGSL